MEKVIQLKNINKSFGKHKIFQDLNWSVKRGKTIGIMGDNGIGKSVLFQIISGLQKPDSGDVIIQGEKIGESQDYPNNMGILINQPGFIGHRTGFENLKLLASIQNKISDEKIMNEMKKMNLDPNNQTKVNKYSTGMKQKLGIIQALMEDQEIILLDEPFNALDVEANRDIGNRLLECQKENKTILIISHSLTTLKRLTDEFYRVENMKIRPFQKEDEMRFQDF
ncbi:MAG: ATP-binding cassette domain-containing protein [Tissierellia bacterium]|nr:ATP-binding cassette domain-containing protein [Tissierellia bacterium]